MTGSSDASRLVSSERTFSRELCVFAAISAGTYILFTALFMMLTTSDSEQVRANGSSIARESKCARCLYVSKNTRPLKNTALLINITGTDGTGRTGNYLRDIRIMLEIAYACKGQIILPSADARNNAYVPDISKRMFDFASRPGLNCSIPSNATYISGNLSKMRMWRSTPNITLPYKLIGDEGRETVSLCFRHYLGFCEESYCQNQDTQSDILVAHLRQGDLFPPNFKRSYHEPMWSLPMTAYLSVSHTENGEKFSSAQNQHQIRKVLCRRC